MALIFSVVKLQCANKTTSFLIGGKALSKEDLAGWVAYKNFIGNIEVGEPIEAMTEIRRYGDNENFDATPEEIAYFMERIKLSPDFVNSRSELLQKNKFVFEK